ncbi:methyltransferase [Nitrobacter sp.]|jgi:protein-S-isoprenylcysteine O-methyltransferase Ste14|uniref:methyltransferase n=1 Tax=Nitrobacter sp. TaxID=29420 RepID=UPI003F64FFFB
MEHLGARAFGSLVIVIVVMACVLFGTAGTFDYWQAWIFLACYGMASLVLTLYMLRYDPALLRRRMRGGPFAEKEPAQKLIMLIASAEFIALLVVPALDRRFAWSHMPAIVALLGNAVMAFGWFAIYRVFRENSFTSATIEVAQDQTVITTGPYARVRHPMYAGALVMFAGIPVALGSWWGLLVVLTVLPLLIWRLLDEENFLARDLPGYTAYQQTTRYRLIPGIW